jgi:hypothetical protein
MLVTAPSTTTAIALRLAPQADPASLVERPAVPLQHWRPGHGLIAYFAPLGAFAGPLPFWNGQHAARAAVHPSRKSRTNRVSAASPYAQSSTVIASSGLWLMPPMPAGHRRPIAIVLWLAPREAIPAIAMPLCSTPRSGFVRAVIDLALSRRKALIASVDVEWSVCCVHVKLT